MDEDEVVRWRKCARLVYRAIAVGTDREVQSGLVRVTFLNNSLNRRLRDGRPWGSPQVARLLRDLVARPGVPEHLGDGHLDEHAAANFLRLKAVRIGYAVVANRPDLVGAADARALLDIHGVPWDAGTAGFLRRVADAPPPRVDAVSGPIPYDAFHASSAGFVGEVPRHAGTRSIEHLMSVPSAPVAYEIERPDGGSLDLVRHEGWLYRPVLRPGRWDPIGIDEFVAAIGCGHAWIDNPFHSGLPPVLRRIDVADHAPEPLAGARRRDADPRDAGAAHVAASLVAIDGVVHRRTATPVIGLVAVGLGHRGVPFSVDRWEFRRYWRLPDGLSSLQDQDVMAPPARVLRFLESQVPERHPGDAWFVSEAFDALRARLERAPGFSFVDGGAVVEVDPQPSAGPVERLVRDDALWRDVVGGRLDAARRFHPGADRTGWRDLPGTGCPGKPPAAGDRGWFDGVDFDPATLAVLACVREAVPPEPDEGLSAFEL